MTQPNCDFITIIAVSAAEAMRQFKAQGLDLQGYSIVSKIGRHAFRLVSEEGVAPLFADEPMFAAVFMRVTPAALA